MAEDIQLETDLTDLAERVRLYAELAQITVYESVFRFARKLAFRLYADTREAAPEPETLAELPAKLNYLIKRRKPGLTASQEIWLRIRAIGFTSIGWLTAAKELGAKEESAADAEFDGSPGDLASRTVVMRAGGVEIYLNGTEPYITLENMTPGADVLEQQRGIIYRAYYETIADMDVYLERKLKELAEEQGFDATTG